MIDYLEMRNFVCTGCYLCFSAAWRKHCNGACPSCAGKVVEPGSPAHQIWVDAKLAAHGPRFKERFYWWVDGLIQESFNGAKQYRMFEKIPSPPPKPLPERIEDLPKEKLVKIVKKAIYVCQGDCHNLQPLDNVIKDQTGQWSWEHKI